MSLYWFKQRENILALSLALIVLVLHLIIIEQVVENIFDEKHYVPEAKAIIDREELDNLEHPPLGKIFIAAGIDIFGDNPFGWRIFSVLFGVAAIILFYLICQKLTANKYIPLIATFIFAFENQSFIQSSMAMLDVYSLTLLLASFWLYLRGNYLSSGIVLALCALAKLTGIFGAAVIILHWFFIRRTERWTILKFLITAPLAFFVLMPLLDYIAMGELIYPWDRIEFMRDNLSTLTFSDSDHEALSRPWEWITSTGTQWFWYDPTYQSNPNWNLWVFIIPAICYALYGAIKRNSLCLFALLWFASTYLSWIAMYFITDRIMFRFYFYPTVGAICLIVGFVLYRIWVVSSKRENVMAKWALRVPVISFLITHLVLFILMSPYCDLRVGSCCP